MIQQNFSQNDIAHATRLRHAVTTEIIPQMRWIALQHYRSEGLGFQTKSDGSPVTVADQNAETAFRDWTRAHHPSIGIIGEEFGNVNTDAEWVWTVDPIDGTRAFTRGLPFWGIQIGLLHKGEPVMGVVDYPLLQENLWSVKGVGCFHGNTGKRCSISQEKILSNSVLLHSGASSFENLSPHLQATREAYHALTSSVYLERAYGDCVAYSYLVKNQADVVMDRLSKAWDIVPMMALVEEAGGVFLTLTHGKRDWNANDMFVATNPVLFTQIRSIFSSALNP